MKWEQMRDAHEIIKYKFSQSTANKNNEDVIEIAGSTANFKTIEILLPIYRRSLAMASTYLGITIPGPGQSQILKRIIIK